MATANDRAVLQTIFNPSTPFGDIPGLDEDEDVRHEGEADAARSPAGSFLRGWKGLRLHSALGLPLLPRCHRALGRGTSLPRTEEEAFEPELLEQVRDLELQGVSAAESGDVSAALERFSEAIRLLPQRASAYNNRAQALRLKGDVAGKDRGTG